MKYLIEGLTFYNKYIRRTLGLQINDLKMIYSKIIADATGDNNKSYHDKTVEASRIRLDASKSTMWLGGNNQNCRLFFSKLISISFCLNSLIASRLFFNQVGSE
jgi:hypothetical protein